MSEQPTAPNSGGGGGNVFTKQIGPMPLWGWMGVGLAIALAFMYWQQNKKSSATQATNAATDSTGTTDSSLIPQFVNQVYTGTQPPTMDQTPGPPGPPGPPGQPGTPAPRPIKQFGAVQGVAAKAISRTAATINWNYITSPARPNSYTVAVYNKKGDRVAYQTVNAPDTRGTRGTVTITGLPNGQGPFKADVWANGGQIAPPHGEAKFSLL